MYLGLRNFLTSRGFSSIVRTWLKEDRIQKKKSSGRKWKLSQQAVRRLRLLILLNRFWTRGKIYEKFKELYGHQISFRTFLRYCRRIGATRAPNCKKEVLTNRHRRLRIGWVRTRKFWSLDKWSKVIFSDECSIKIGADKRVYVWKMSDEGYYRPDLYGDLKTPQYKVMIWGCITWFGTGTISVVDGTLDSSGYLKLLDENLWPVVAKHFPDGEYMFMDDGASIHTAHIIREYKEAQSVKTLVWPPKSPDLNPIENLWHILKLKIRHRISEINSNNDLGRIVREEWARIGPHYVQGLYRSMPRRCKMVQLMKGHRTKY